MRQKLFHIFKDEIQEFQNQLKISSKHKKKRNKNDDIRKMGKIDEFVAKSDVYYSERTGKMQKQVRPLSGIGALRGGKLEPKRLRSGKTVNRVGNPRQLYKLDSEYAGITDIGFKFLELDK